MMAFSVYPDMNIVFIPACCTVACRANATPVTYRLRPDSKQYVAVAAGGHGWSEPGDAMMAFSLP